MIMRFPFAAASSALLFLRPTAIRAFANPPPPTADPGFASASAAPSVPRRRRRTFLSTPNLASRNSEGDEVGGSDAGADDGGVGGGGGGDDPVPSDDSFFASLRARREALRSRSSEIRNRWVGAKCQSAVRLALDDWVRRLDARRWPLAALGSAKGSVLVVDLERGSVVARTADSVHSPYGGNPNGNLFLFGEYDGGGTLSIAMRGDSVISAGREGGAKAWRLDREGGELVPMGELASVGRNSMATSIEIDDEGKVWVATYDGMYGGTVHRFDLLERAPLSEQEPLTVKTDAGVLSLAVSDELGLAVAGTAAGTVELISTEDGSKVGSWEACNSTHVRAVEIFHAGLLDDDDAKNNKWCIVCGGGDGSMRMRWLNTEEGRIVTSAPFDMSRPPNSLPPHSGMVVTLTACRKNGAGMLVSGAQDGTLRIWDFSDDPLSEGDEFSSEFELGSDGVADPEFQPIVLYQLVGYKVWLGSVCVDEEGLRLISDGADNTVVVHDFSYESE